MPSVTSVKNKRSSWESVPSHDCYSQKSNSIILMTVTGLIVSFSVVLTEKIVCPMQPENFAAVTIRWLMPIGSSTFSVSFGSMIATNPNQCLFAVHRVRSCMVVLHCTLLVLVDSCILLTGLRTSTFSIGVRWWDIHSRCSQLSHVRGWNAWPVGRNDSPRICSQWKNFQVIIVAMDHKTITAMIFSNYILGQRCRGITLQVTH